MKRNYVFKILLPAVFMIFPVLILSKSIKKIPTEKGAFFNTDTSSVWIAPKSANKIKNPLKGKSGAAKKGETLFLQNCVECHGTAGKGDGQNADLLDVKPADLTSRKVQKQTDGELFWKISNGKEPMAPYKNILSEEQRWQLINYVRQLAKKKK